MGDLRARRRASFRVSLSMQTAEGEDSEPSRDVEPTSSSPWSSRLAKRRQRRKGGIGRSEGRRTGPTSTAPPEQLQPPFAGDRHLSSRARRRAPAATRPEQRETSCYGGAPPASTANPLIRTRRSSPRAVRVLPVLGGAAPVGSTTLVNDSRRFQCARPGGGNWSIRPSDFAWRLRFIILPPWG